MTNLSDIYDVANNIRGKGKNFCRPTVGQFFKSDRGYDETDNWCKSSFGGASLFLRGNAFVDETGNHVVNNTDITLNTTITKYGSSYSFVNNSGYLEIPISASSEIGVGDFTMDTWMYRTTNTIDCVISLNNYLGENKCNGLMCNLMPSPDHINIHVATGYTNSSLSTPWKLGQWQHLAITRENGNIYVFVDGILESSYVFTGNITSGGNNLNISGYGGGGGNSFNGYLERFRYKVGTALWTSNFNLTDQELFY